MADLLPPALAGHVVHLVHSFEARKDYLCPDCGNGIGERETHVVAWPDGHEGDRRHWHRHCWRLYARGGGGAPGRRRRRKPQR